MQAEQYCRSQVVKSDRKAWIMRESGVRFEKHKNLKGAT